MNYKIIGEPMPAVQCDLQSGETIRTQRGAMIWMSTNMNMETTSGGVMKAFGRLLTKESLFQNIYTAIGGPGTITLGSSFVGSIRAIPISPSRSIICNKSAFLACEAGVELSVHLQHRMSVGFFSGEGFIMQKLTGNGMVFLEVDGYPVEYVLEKGQSLLVNTGNVSYMESTCTISIERIRGARNIAFGGEGFYNTKVTGPGRVSLQTMSVSSFVESLAPFLSNTSS